MDGWVGGMGMDENGDWVGDKLMILICICVLMNENIRSTQASTFLDMVKCNVL